MPLLSGVLASLIITASAVSASGDRARATVTVNWSNVPDRVVDRCGIASLQNVLLQALIEEGMAVAAEGGDVAVWVTVEGGAFVITGAAVSGEATRRLRIPRLCDSSILLDLQRAVSEVARELSSRTADFDAGKPQPFDASTVEDAPAVVPSAHMGLSVGMTYDGRRAGGLLGIAYPAPAEPSRWTVAGRLDVQGYGSRAVLVLRTGLGAVLTVDIAPGLQTQLGAAVVLVTSRARQRGTGWHGDAEARAGLRYRLAAGWALGLALHGRARPSRVWIDGARRFEESPWLLVGEMSW